MADRVCGVPARVVYVSSRNTIQILLAPGQGAADGGIPVEIPLELVPVELRMPNSELLVTLRNGTVTSVSRDD